MVNRRANRYFGHLKDSGPVNAENGMVENDQKIKELLQILKLEDQKAQESQEGDIPGEQEVEQDRPIAHTVWFVHDLKADAKKKLEQCINIVSNRNKDSWNPIIEKFEIPLCVHCHLHRFCCREGFACNIFLDALVQREPDTTLRTYIQKMRDIMLLEGAKLLIQDLVDGGNLSLASEIQDRVLVDFAEDFRFLVSLRSCHGKRDNWCCIAEHFVQRWNDDPVDHVMKCFYIGSDNSLWNFGDMVVRHLSGKGTTLADLNKYCSGWEPDDFGPCRILFAQR